MPATFADTRTGRRSPSRGRDVKSRSSIAATSRNRSRQPHAPRFWTARRSKHDQIPWLAGSIPEAETV
jgi:hypothetical protein